MIEETSNLLVEPRARPVEGISEVGMLTKLAQIRFPEPGTYQFEILVDNEKIGDVPLTARLQKPEEPENESR